MAAARLILGRLTKCRKYGAKSLISSLLLSKVTLALDAARNHTVWTREIVKQTKMHCVTWKIDKTPLFERFRSKCTLCIFKYTLVFLAEISFIPLLYHLEECLGCQEKRTSSRNYNLFVWSAVFQPKWNDIQKSYKNYQNPVKSYCFLGYYQSLFNLGWKTAAQTN